MSFARSYPSTFPWLPICIGNHPRGGTLLADPPFTTLIRGHDHIHLCMLRRCAASETFSIVSHPEPKGSDGFAASNIPYFIGTLSIATRSGQKSALQSWNVACVFLRHEGSAKRGKYCRVRMGGAADLGQTLSDHPISKRRPTKASSRYHPGERNQKSNITIWHPSSVKPAARFEQRLCLRLIEHHYSTMLG
ncbi:hypothetical protein B0H34DRAFT_728012 [Crassisporium funariophilum]|nr:hypothetical protein B0H34DRAFT_728012 [Crassisporium funariophilum]